MNWLSFLILTTLHLAPVLSSQKTLSDVASLDDVPVLHFTIQRRGGSFDPHSTGKDVANLTYLSNELIRIQERYDLTRRKVKGNKLVRNVKEQDIGGSGGDGRTLMSTVSEAGRWFAKLRIGDPPQVLELDLDLLTSDFFVLTTTSGKGRQYDDLFSKSLVKSSFRPFPGCIVSTESFRLPSTANSTNLQFAYCRPLKSSSRTLESSGSMLGLAPSPQMAQVDSPSLIGQLLEKEVIKRQIFSIMVINSHKGVLSIGGTAAKAIELAAQQTREELDKLNPLSEIALQDKDARLTKRDKKDKSKLLSGAWDDAFRWSHVEGAEGWWQILMAGIWVNGAKVLKNQPVVLDLNVPFILAPPSVAHTLYSGIPGALPLHSPYEGFYTFPCLNPPSLAFEFAGWNFPAFKGSKDADRSGRETWGRDGGRFSLGRVEEGSGFCVGAVVGVELEKGGRRKSDVEGNGMGGVWVLGEMWFRGVSAMFDVANQRVGFRSV